MRISFNSFSKFAWLELFKDDDRNSRRTCEIVEHIETVEHIEAKIINLLNLIYKASLIGLQDSHNWLSRLRGTREIEGHLTNS